MKRISYLFLFLLGSFGLYLWQYDRTQKEEYLAVKSMDSTFYDTEEKQRTLLVKTQPQDVLRFYQMMKDVHDLFGREHLSYWITCGTLLGAVRHQGMIPWDDDIDLCIDRKQEAAFVKLRDAFARLGYGLCKTLFGYKIFPFDGKSYQRKTWLSFFTGRESIVREFRYPFVDVFITREEEGKIFYDRRKARRGWANDVIFIHELYPLKKWPFGELELYGPSHAAPFLTRMYGDTWPEQTYRSYDHGNEKKVVAVAVPLQGDDLLPAQPTGPLQQRVTEAFP